MTQPSSSLSRLTRTLISSHISGRPARVQWAERSAVNWNTSSSSSNTPTPTPTAGMDMDRTNQSTKTAPRQTGRAKRERLDGRPSSNSNASASASGAYPAYAASAGAGGSTSAGRAAHAHARAETGRARGRGEPSGYKRQQQRRTREHDGAREAWSVAQDPNVRVDASTTRVLQARDRVKAHVERTMQGAFGDKYRVEYFGSTRYGVSHSHSDLDMIVIDPNYPQGYVREEFSERIYNPRHLATAVRRAGFVDVEYRRNSSVPIVKFKDRQTGLDCDLNVNERLGIVNSDMIKEYCDIAPVLRPMLFSIKEWAKPLSLNSPSGGAGVSASFSSYAFALMTIVFLQKHCDLPNLQEDLPPLSPSLEDRTLVWTRKPHRGWDARFRKDLEKWTLPDVDVRILMRKWYRFWETFPYDEKCASIRHGEFLDRTSPLLGEYKDQATPAAVCVVDPFIRTKNVAGAVPRKVLERFKAECGKAAGLLA